MATMVSSSLNALNQWCRLHGDTIALFLLSLSLGAFLFFKLSKSWKRAKSRKKFRHGLRGEKKAGSILKAHGYKLIDTQQDIKASIHIGGRRHQYTIRPDGIARRGNKVYAVEVKTGAVATNPLSSQTRRQILEYYYHCPVDAVLFVDADNWLVQEVVFPHRFTSRAKRPSIWILISLILSSLLVYLIYSL